ncbi:Ig-like domain-containing protein [Rhizobium sp.]
MLYNPAIETRVDSHGDGGQHSQQEAAPGSRSSSSPAGSGKGTDSQRFAAANEIQDLNHAPEASGGYLTAIEDTDYVFSVSDFSFSDVDGDALSAVVIVTLPGEGEGMLLLDGVAVQAGDSIDVSDIIGGKLVYQPRGNEFGVARASVTFKVVDDGGTEAGGTDTSGAYTLTFNIDPVEDAPTGANRVLPMVEDVPAAIDTWRIGFADADYEGFGAIIITTLPTSGALTLDGVAVGLGDTVAAADIVAGKLVYTPGANASGFPLATMGFKVVDTGGTESVDAYTMSFNVSPANDAPTAADSTISMVEDHAFTFTVENFGFADIDGDALLDVIIDTLPEGTLLLDGIAVQAGDSIAASDIADGKLVYTPPADANGRGLASLTFRVVDDNYIESATSGAYTITFDVAGDPAEEERVNTSTYGDQIDQNIIALSDGGWVVTWRSNTAGVEGIYQQGYNADGTSKGNETRLDSQGYFHELAPLADGGWVVVWGTWGNAGRSAYQQVYNADGTPQADVSQVENPAAGKNLDTKVASLADGGWVLTWWLQAADNYSTLVQQVYNADGTKRGTEAEVATRGYDSRDTQITILADGGWVIAWSRYDGSSSDPKNVFQHAFNADGTERGQEQQVNTTAQGEQAEPSIIALADGGWVIAWIDGYQSVYQQAYNADGTVRGDEIEVTSGAYLEMQNIMALADGGWVATWMPYNANGGVDILQQVYNADGSARGAATGVNTKLVSPSYPLTITTLSDGGWVVTWTSRYEDGDRFGIAQQAYNADGTRRGEEVQVNTEIVGDQSDPQITALVGGGWAVTWISEGQDGSGKGIYQQRYDSAGQPYGSNHAPGTVDRLLFTDEDTDYTFTSANFAFSDPDGDALAAVIVVTLPAQGTLMLDGVAVEAGDRIAAGDIAAGKLVYVPGANDNGAGRGVFTFRVVDDGGTEGGGFDTSEIRKVEFHISSVNDAPTGADSTVSVTEDTSVLIQTSKFGFADVDAFDKLSHVIITALPSAGTLTLDGVPVEPGASISREAIVNGGLRYVPAPNASGLAALEFKVVDLAGEPSVDSYTMTFDIAAVADAPTAASRSVTLLESRSFTFTTANFGFADADGDALLEIVITGLPDSGLVTLNGIAVQSGNRVSASDIAAGKLIYTPPRGDNGAGYDSMQFKVVDDSGNVRNMSDQHSITFDIVATPAGQTRINIFSDNSQSSQQIVALPDGGWVVTWESYGQRDHAWGIFQQVYDADGLPVGDETKVHTTETDSLYAPQIAVLDDGGWVVIWSNFNNDRIYAQAFNPDGTMRGDEIDVDANIHNPLSMRVTAIANGGWVVSWESLDRDGDGSGIHQQAYDDDGSPLDNPNQVNTHWQSEQGRQQVTALADGGWVVTWSSSGQDGDQGGIYQQAFDSDGSAVGEEIQVNTTTAGNQKDQQVTMLVDGGWLVVWQSSNDATGDFDIHQRAFNADGTPRSVETQVNTGTYGERYFQQVTTLADGGWVVTWIDYGQDGGDGDVYQQAYDADGARRGVETRVNTSTVGLQFQADMTALADGGWVVTWTSAHPDDDIYQQAYNSDGTARGIETRVNTETYGAQTKPQVTALADGGWVVTWESNRWDGAGSDLYQQRYEASGQVYGVNHAPEASDVTLTTLEDAPYIFSTADFGFQDGAGDILSAVVIATLPTSGTLTLLGEAVQAGDVISADDIANGRLVYTPAAHANGTGRASLTFRVRDDAGTEAGGVDTSGIHTLAFDITAVNDAPTAMDATVTIKEDKAFAFSAGNFGFGDSLDGDAFQSVTITALPTSGTLTFNGIAVTADQNIDVEDLGSLVWKPARDAFGTGLASLKFTVTDDGGAANGGQDTSSVHTLTFDVTDVVDRFNGTRRSESINGTSGADIIWGGKGADNLTGGAGADSFVFKSIAESTVKANGRDFIRDFDRTEDDLIDLAKIDANTTKKGNQAFDFIGKQGFHDVAGELRFEKTGSGTYIYGDVDGDGKADFAIRLAAKMAMRADDFAL